MGIRAGASGTLGFGSLTRKRGPDEQECDGRFA